MFKFLSKPTLFVISHLSARGVFVPQLQELTAQIFQGFFALLLERILSLSLFSAGVSSLKKKEERFDYVYLYLYLYFCLNGVVKKIIFSF